MPYGKSGRAQAPSRPRPFPELQAGRRRLAALHLTLESVFDPSAKMRDMHGERLRRSEGRIAEEGESTLDEPRGSILVSNSEV
jgi:hypothetical protein